MVALPRTGLAQPSAPACARAPRWPGQASAALVVLAALAGAADATPRRGTFAYDYRNVPIVTPLDGYEAVVLSTRGALRTTTLDTLAARGARALVLVQPTLAFTDRRAEYPYDAAVFDACAGKVLHTATGDTAWLEIGAGKVPLPDYGAPGVAEALADVVMRSFARTGGVVFDYAYGGPPLNGIAPDVAARWGEGWSEFVDRLRKSRPDWWLVCQVDHFTLNANAARCDGLLLERVGSSLTPAAKVWQQVTSDPESRFLLRQEWEAPSTRRLFASIALVNDGLFNLSADPNKAPSKNVRDPEHWELELGIAPGGWWAREPQVYQCMFTRGLVLVNLSSATVRYAYNTITTFTIPPLDALVLQNRDARGRFIVARTTLGR